jgi:hypothetical protein
MGNLGLWVLNPVSLESGFSVDGPNPEPAIEVGVSRR